MAFDIDRHFGLHVYKVLHQHRLRFDSFDTYFQNSEKDIILCFWSAQDPIGKLFQNIF